MDKLNSDSKVISASEVNKFVYCPYQWYYERLYGTKQLRALYNERNKELGLDDPTMSNFNKGLKFHKEYKLSPSISTVFAGLLAIALIIAVYVVIFMGWLPW